MTNFNLIFIAFSLVGLSQAKILAIEKVEVDIDAAYMKVAPKLEVVDGINTINIDIDVLKEADGVIYQAVVFRHNVDHYEHFYKTDLENDCNHEAIKDPVLSFILKESKKYGNITEVCPLKLGHYQLRHFRIDSADLPNELPAGQYRFDFSAYIKRKDELHDIYTDKYYFTA